MRFSLLLPLLLAAACADEGDDTAPSETDADTDTDTDTGVVSVPIVAAEGGTVEAFGSTLTVPAGALAADTTITVRILEPDATIPDAPNVRSDLLDFGPDGTTFSTPATLTIAATSSPVADKTLAVAWLDEGAGAWVPLSSTVADPFVAAPVSHFTTFGALEIESSTTTAGVCDFTACGGDLAGTSWELLSVCESGGVDNDSVTCPTADIFTVVDATRPTVTFTGTDGGPVDGDHGSQTCTKTWTVPAECLDTGVTCEELNVDWRDVPVPCTGAPPDACVCADTLLCPDASPIRTRWGLSSAWSADGTTLTVSTEWRSESGSTYFSDQAFAYCVDGATLTIEDGDEILTYSRL